MRTLVSVGKVSKLFGSNGGLYINLYPTMPDDINNEEPLYVKIDTLAVPLFLDNFDRRGRKGAVVLFADIDTNARAEELIGLELFIPSESAVAEQESERGHGQLYCNDLIGYLAIFGPKTQGTVTDFIASDMNPLFCVAIDGREVLIPAANDFIKKIDTDKRIVKFTLPDGLLEL